MQALPIDQIRPRPGQPRRRFEEAGLRRLAESIKKHGVLQPIAVRPVGENEYEIEAGDRRWRAVRLAGLEVIPATTVELNDQEALAISLLENLQREDLNPFEELEGVLQLLSLELEKPVEDVISLLRRMRHEKRGEVGHNVVARPEAETVDQVFAAVGRMTWESFVQHRLPLLGLPDDLKAALREGRIPYTAALELRRVRDEEKRAELLEAVVAGKLSVRELREKVRRLLEREAAPTPVVKTCVPSAEKHYPPDREGAPGAPGDRGRGAEIERHLEAIEGLLE